jgi:1-deoxy-D-xylulose-5-phosphate reductoisomerase
MKKGIIILGSTGSIGRATLEVVENQKDDFDVIGLACKENVELFTAQVEKYRPKYACISTPAGQGLPPPSGVEWFSGPEGLKEIVRGEGAIVVNALPGSSGLDPTIETLKQGKILALANKESLVMAGRLIRKLAEEKGARLIPVDSEHSALYQLLAPIDRKEIEELIITASGGPFRNHTGEDLRRVSPEEALQHPTWKMGKKVTLDSATLMNKGFEVIEARWLFNMDHEKVRVVIHPESIIHGMVQLIDGSLLSYLSFPDMRIPIAFALNEGKRYPLPFGKMNLADIGNLTFYRPDTNRFPALRLAYEALELGDSAAITLNASNDVASSAFLEGRIGFTEIPLLIEEALANHPPAPVIEDIETIWEIHRWAGQYVKERLRRIDG